MKISTKDQIGQFSNPTRKKPTIVFVWLPLFSLLIRIIQQDIQHLMLARERVTKRKGKLFTAAAVFGPL